MWQLQVELPNFINTFSLTVITYTDLSYEQTFLNVYTTLIYSEKSPRKSFGLTKGIKTKSLNSNILESCTLI